MIRSPSSERLGLEFLDHCQGDGLGAPLAVTGVIWGLVANGAVRQFLVAVCALPLELFAGRMLGKSH